MSTSPDMGVKSPPTTPSKPSILKHSSGKILQLGSKMGTYILLSDVLPKPSLGMVSFEAKGMNDILTCFHHEERLCVGHEGREDTAPAYEILIGGWLNTKTVIRKQGNIQAAVTKTSKPEAMITKTDFDKYWIAIEGDRLSVGKGEPGENKVLSWRDAQPKGGIAYVGFGSWHNPVLIKNIKIMMPVVTEEKLARRFDPLKVHDWFNQGRFSDVVLKTPKDGLEFQAHRAVLFAASRPFENLVRSAPSHNDTVRLCPVYLMPEELPGPILLQLLKFIYTGKVIIDANDSASLSQWASYFDLTVLISLCKTFEERPATYYGVEMKAHSLAAPTKADSGEIHSGSPAAFRSPLQDLNIDTTRQHDYSKLYQRSLFSDVMFVIKSPPEAPTKYEKTIPVHKIVLALKSEPFGLMFSTGMMESSMKKIEMVENYEIFELMLRFIYSGQSKFLRDLNINDVLVPLLTMADRFAVYPLRTVLSEIFAEFINLDSVCVLVNIATFYGLTTLRRKCLQFIETHFSQVVESEAFLELEAGPLLEIIFGDDLVVPSEKDVFDALMTWGVGSVSSPKSQSLADSFQESFNNDEKTQRLAELKQLLSYVRYPLIDQRSLQSILMTNEIVQTTSYLLEAVSEAFEEKMAQSTSSMGSSLPFAGGSSSSLSSSLTGLPDEFLGLGTSSVFSPNGSLSTLPPMTSSYGTLPPFSPDTNSTSPLAAAALVGQPPRRASYASSRPGAFHTNSRKTNAIQFLFSHCGDENGALYWLATNGGTERWQNPHKVGKVVVTCSTPPSRWTSLPALVNRTFITNNYASGSSSAPAWWCIDLTSKFTLQANYYTLQTDGSANVIGDWELQGSLDNQTWTVLRMHENSRATFTQGGGKEYSWPIDLALQPATGFRYFRLIVTSASAAQPHKFSLAGVELYGHMYRTESLSDSTSEIPAFTPPNRSSTSVEPVPSSSSSSSSSSSAQ